MVPPDLFAEVQKLRDEYRSQHAEKTPERAAAASMGTQ
jgi:hypothetical protein